MKRSALVAISAIALGLFGCSTGGSDDASGGGGSGTSDEELRRLGTNGALSCKATSGDERVALVGAGGGKTALVSLTPAGDLFALSGSTGTLTSSSTSWSWKAGSSSLEVANNLDATWKRGSKTTKVKCAAASKEEAASWKAASGLVTYAGEIDGLAETVLENDENAPTLKPYTVYVVETSKRDSLSLGTKEANSTGALPGTDDDQERADENDFSYGAMSAAYSLGGGDDYGEWFQGASDGISLTGDLVPTLAANARAGFIAHKDVKALKSLVDSGSPSAVEITVGPWTYFLPDAFPK